MGESGGGRHHPRGGKTAEALEAGYAALHWLSLGYGYEVKGADVWMACASAMKTASSSFHFKTI